MRFVGIAILVLCAVVAIQADPIEKKKPKCDGICPAVYQPVCGADLTKPSEKPKLFGNKCTLGVHNCEHNSNLVEVDMKKCKNSGGIRLS